MGRHLVTAHQANFLPYLGFFEKILVSDAFVLVDDTQFVKRGAFGWIHRNRILGSGDEPLWLTVPVVTHGRYEQKILEVEIDNARDWRRKHWRSIVFAYRHAPYFKELGPGLEAIYANEWGKLFDLSRSVIAWVLEILKVSMPVSLASSLEIGGSGSGYVLELARKSGATHYLSGIHGKDYLNVTDFEKAGMGLVFQDFSCLPYFQGKRKSFVSHLAIIDALFWTGAEGTRQLMQSGGKSALPPRS